MTGWARLAVVASAAWMIGGTEASADTGQNSANGMMPGCRSVLANNGKATTLMAAYCLGIVRGLAFGASGSILCLPEGITYEQMVRVVVAYLDRDPSQWHMSFDLLAYGALITTWPCEAKGR